MWWFSTRPAVGFGREGDFFQEPGAGEGVAVEGGAFAAGGGPAGEMRQLDGQHGGLERVEAEVAADELVEILLRHAVHAGGAQTGCEGRGPCAVVRPPSPNAPRFFDGKKLNQPSLPIEPAR